MLFSMIWKNEGGARVDFRSTGGSYIVPLFRGHLFEINIFKNDF